MLLGKQLYTLDTDGCTITYSSERPKTALNILNSGWVDAGYNLAKTLLKRHRVVVTDQDLLARDDYIDSLSLSHTVVFFHHSGKLSASKKRLKNAQSKLKDLGYRTKFFVSEDALNRYLAKQDGSKPVLLKPNRTNNQPVEFGQLRLV